MSYYSFLNSWWQLLPFSRTQIMLFRMKFAIRQMWEISNFCVIIALSMRKSSPSTFTSSPIYVKSYNFKFFENFSIFLSNIHLTNFNIWSNLKKIFMVKHMDFTFRECFRGLIIFFKNTDQTKTLLRSVFYSHFFFVK